MQQFSLDKPKLRRSQVVQNMLIVSYLALCLFGLLYLAAALLTDQMNFENHYLLLGYYALMVVLLLATISLFSLLHRFNQYIHSALTHWQHKPLEIGQDRLRIHKSNHQFDLQAATITNYFFAYNSKSPFFGLGYVQLSQDQQTLFIPSLLFHHSVGAITARELFHAFPHYSEEKLSYRSIMKRMQH